MDSTLSPPLAVCCFAIGSESQQLLEFREGLYCGLIFCGCFDVGNDRHSLLRGWILQAAGVEKHVRRLAERHSGGVDQGPQITAAGVRRVIAVDEVLQGCPMA